MSHLLRISKQTFKFLNDFNSISYVNVIKNLMKPELDELTKNNKND